MERRGGGDGVQQRSKQRHLSCSSCCRGLAVASGVTKISVPTFPFFSLSPLSSPPFSFYRAASVLWISIPNLSGYFLVSVFFYIYFKMCLFLTPLHLLSLVFVDTTCDDCCERSSVPAASTGNTGRRKGRHAGRRAWV